MPDFSLTDIDYAALDIDARAKGMKVPFGLNRQNIYIDIILKESQLRRMILIRKRIKMDFLTLKQ